MGVDGCMCACACAYVRACVRVCKIHTVAFHIGKLKGRKKVDNDGDELAVRDRSIPTMEDNDNNPLLGMCADVCVHVSV